MDIIQGSRKLTQHEDLRVVKTRRNIEQTFLRLLQDEPFDKITVRMVCEEALVNKGTFYRHYEDKYDLARKTIDDELQRLHTEILDRTQNVGGKTDPEQNLTSLFDAIRGVVADLRVLERLNDSDLGIDVRAGIRTVIADGLSLYVRSGFVLDNIDTAAWIMTEFLMNYSRYCEEVENPLDVYGYIRAINDLSGMHLNLMPHTFEGHMGCLARYTS